MTYKKVTRTRILFLTLLFTLAGCAEGTPTTISAPPGPSPSATIMASRSPSPTPTMSTEETRVEELLNSMTTEQKVGQLFVVHFNEPYFSPTLEKLITQYHVGGIIIFGRNVTTLTDLAQLINQAQQAATSSEPGIPLFVATDQEGWPVLRLKDEGTDFPSNMAVGATGSVSDAQLMATTMAEELTAVGINMNLAPVMDVNSNPANPIIGIRSFGSSPELVSRLGTAMIESYEAQGIVATAKHFPGHGDTAVDSHLSLPLITHDRARLESEDLVPFEAAISAGVDCIMTAHISVPAIDPAPDRPATLSAPILQGLLREQMGFQGLIATDSLGMKAITDQHDPPTAAALAFQAGADLLMFGDDPGHDPSEQYVAYERVMELVQQGVVPMERVDDTVRRILLLKARRGILDWRPTEIGRIADNVGTEEHLAAARQVARDSITLVRDHEHLLPLDSESPILVVYPPGGAGLFQAVQEHAADARSKEVSIRPSASEIDQVLTGVQDTQVAVLGTLDVQKHPEQGRLVEALDGHHRLIAVSLSSPYDLLSYPQVSTYLTAYGQAPVSMQAAARVLFGIETPRGRLPVELPGLYALGHGLLEVR